MVGNQIHASYVDWRTISSKNPEPGHFGKEGSPEHGNPKTCMYILTKIDKTPDNSTYQNESHKYTHPWHVCLPNKNS